MNSRDRRVLVERLRTTTDAGADADIDRACDELERLAGWLEYLADHLTAGDSAHRVGRSFRKLAARALLGDPVPSDSDAEADLADEGLLKAVLAELDLTHIEHRALTGTVYRDGGEALNAAVAKLRAAYCRVHNG